MVILCEGVMESGTYLMSAFVSERAAHLLVFPLVTLLGTALGSRILTTHKTFRKQLLAEIRARDLAQQQQSESARELKQDRKSVV